MNRPRTPAPRLVLVLLAALPALLQGCHTDAFCLDCTDDTSTGSQRDGGDFANADGGTALRDGGPGGSGSGGSGAPPACFPSELGEQCNGLDEDCDGEVDEGFDLTTNLLHCGRCDNPCRADNAETACVDGACQVHGCLEGFGDLDGQAGCEYRCPAFPAGPEDCNGYDDDCDGAVDEQLAPPPRGLCRTTRDTACASVEAICIAREGTTTWYCDYPDNVEFDPAIPNGIAVEETRCDGEDGDCDGVVDDVWPDVGLSCDNGLLGACRDEGMIRCAAADDTKTECDLSVAPDPVPGAGPAAVELCNAVDDDCDGIVDNSDPSDPKRIVDDMVHIAHGALDFWIYRYEATRPDGSAGAEGIEGTRACSKPDALPWTLVRYEAAQAACAAANSRLCTGAEWLAACQGGASRLYPYGDDYEVPSCQGADRAHGTNDGLLPSGTLPSCASVDDVRDLSGNVKEWTSDQRGTTGAPDNLPIYVIRGGSRESPELGLTCTTELSQATANTALSTLGFRCCADALP